MDRAILIALLAFTCGSCSEYEQPKRWHGLWRDAFEGSQFCPAPATQCDYVFDGQRKQPIIWLEYASSRHIDINRTPDGLYAVEFIGRRTKRPGDYGHMGMFDEEVKVDRMISIREIKE